MANTLKTEKPPKIVMIDKQEDIHVPLKKQIPTEKMICQIHSSGQRREEIKFINLGFIAKNKTEFCRTFLCDLCLYEFRRKNPSNEDLSKIQKVKKFQFKYIESMLEKYSDETISQTTNLLEKAESQLCGDIDALNQSFNQYCEVYKKNIKEIFQTLRKPCELGQIKNFIEGRMNEGMIEEFYNSYKTVKKYSVLIGSKNKDVLDGVFQGFQASMEKISKQVKNDMSLSFSVLKKFIEEYEKPSSEANNGGKMNPENEQKRQSVPNTDERRTKIQNKVEGSGNMNSLMQRKTMQSQRQEKQIKHRKEIQEAVPKNRRRAQSSSSSDSSDDSSDSDSSSSQSHQRRRLMKAKHSQKSGTQKRQRDPHKHKAIQKQNRQKPFRNDRVYMIDQEFMKDSRNRLALYIVVKANTQRSGAERVLRLDINEFKRRYPEAFNRYVNLRDARK